MSVDAASLPCPICLHTGVFNTVQSLKDRLIFVSTNNIMCPVCQEDVSGLDKLTIHLFSHVKFLTTKEQPSTNNTCRNDSHCHKREEKSSEHTKKSKTSSVSKNKPMNRTASPVKYVKIYPKLPVVALNTVPLIDISAGKSDGCSPNNQLYLSTIKSDTAVVQTHKCNICGLQFVDENILNMHKSLVHNLDDNSSHTVTRYDCHLCPKNFKMRGSLMVHLRVAHFGFSSNNSGANQNDKLKDSNEYLQSEKINDLERQDGKQWQCDVCRKCFTTKYFLKKHKRLHTGETPYACTQCNKTFTFQQSYHKHLLYHNDEKPHTCSFCGRSFKELSTLHNHQRIHTGEKPFACESCGKISGKCFRQRVSYLVHRRIHTGAMPYKCTSCNKSFRYKVSQRTHKCQAQPPGTVVRKIEELVEKLKNKSIEHGDNKSNDVNFIEVSEANAELVRTGAKLSLQDMESENFTIISDDFNENIVSTVESSKSNDQNQNVIQTLDELIDYIPMNEKSIPSPSDILKNLCLTNNEDVMNNEKMYFQEEFNSFL